MNRSFDSANSDINVYDPETAKQIYSRMTTRSRLTSDEYQAHLVNPGTVLDRQYMKDFAASIRGDWARGANWSDEAKFKVEILEALADMDLESIETFYEARDADEQGGQHIDESNEKSGY